MASELKMPQLSDTMNEGKILGWKKKEGDPVNRGEALAEVETDKANLEIECFQPGVLLKILVPAGELAKVGEAIAVIGAAGEQVAASRSGGATAPPEQGAQASSQGFASRSPAGSAPPSPPTAASSRPPASDALVSSSVVSGVVSSGASGSVANGHGPAASGYSHGYPSATNMQSTSAGQSSAVVQYSSPPHARNAESLFLSELSDTSSEHTSAPASGRIKASPLARKIAEQVNVDLSLVHGTGPQGRIVRKDIEAARTALRVGGEGVAAQPALSMSQQVMSQQLEALSERGPFESKAPDNGRSPVGSPLTASHLMENAASGLAPSPSAQPGSATLGVRSYPLSKMRETIARRMQESVTQAPHFYVTTAVDMTQAVQLREVLKGRADFKGLSINHFVIKASAYALHHEPRVNRSLKNGLVNEPDAINIGIITAIDDGLLIPVVRNADTLSLRDLIFEARSAIDRARAGRPSSTDLMGGTFSISNLGMYDVENFTAIINPGQGAVLAVSSVREVPLVRNGLVVPGREMKVTLSVDHRVIDGVMAAQFLKFFKESLENPALLMGPA